MLARFLIAKPDGAVGQEVASCKMRLAAEATRFPNLSDFLLECIAPFHSLLKRLLTEATEAGKLRKADPELTRLLLNSLLTGQPVQQATIGIELFQSAEARDVHFEEAWGLFMRWMR